MPFIDIEYIIRNWRRYSPHQRWAHNQRSVNQVNICSLGGHTHHTHTHSPYKSMYQILILDLISYFFFFFEKCLFGTIDRNSNSFPSGHEMQLKTYIQCVLYARSKYYVLIKKLANQTVWSIRKFTWKLITCTKVYIAYNKQILLSVFVHSRIHFLHYFNCKIGPNLIFNINYQNLSNNIQTKRFKNNWFVERFYSRQM